MERLDQVAELVDGACAPGRLLYAAWGAKNETGW